MALRRADISAVWFWPAVRRTTQYAAGWIHMREAQMELDRQGPRSRARATAGQRSNAPMGRLRCRPLSQINAARLTRGSGLPAQCHAMHPPAPVTRPAASARRNPGRPGSRSRNPRRTGGGRVDEVGVRTGQGLVGGPDAHTRQDVGNAFDPVLAAQPVPAGRIRPSIGAPIREDHQDGPPMAAERRR